MGSPLSGYVSSPEDGEALWSIGCLTIFKATGAQTGNTFALIDELAPKSDGIPLHRHVDDDESFYVLDGELAFHLGDSGPISAPAGSFAHIPKGTAHSFRVKSPTARYLILTTAHHEQFYRAIADPAGSRELPIEVDWDMDRIMAACERFNVEILGPPPGAEEA